MHQMVMAHWAHDIRNALGTIALYVDKLERPADPKTVDVVACAHTLLAKVATMCSDAVKQVGQSEAQIRRTGFDITTTLTQVRKLISPTLPRAASLQVAIGRPIQVMADAQDVFRIVFNLANNAAAVARQSGSLSQIRISAEAAGTTAIVKVSDDGPGLPPAVRARLFMPTQSTTGGSGLGLSIARELAERNGGVLEHVESEVGTTFIVELPLHAAAIDPAAALNRARGDLQPQFA